MQKQLAIVSSFIHILYKKKFSNSILHRQPVFHFLFLIQTISNRTLQLHRLSKECIHMHWRFANYHLNVKKTEPELYSHIGGDVAWYDKVWQYINIQAGKSLLWSICVNNSETTKAAKIIVFDGKLLAAVLQPSTLQWQYLTLTLYVPSLS